MSLIRIGIVQSVRCKKPLTLKQFSAINAEKSRLNGENDCLRGLVPQESNAFYMTAYGKMYERLEKMDWLTRMVS